MKFLKLSLENARNHIKGVDVALTGLEPSKVLRAARKFEQWDMWDTFQYEFERPANAAILKSWDIVKTHTDTPICIYHNYGVLIFPLSLRRFIRLYRIENERLDHTYIIEQVTKSGKVKVRKELPRTNVNGFLRVINEVITDTGDFYEGIDAKQIPYILRLSHILEIYPTKDVLSEFGDLATELLTDTTQSKLSNFETSVNDLKTQVNSKPYISVHIKDMYYIRKQFYVQEYGKQLFIIGITERGKDEEKKPLNDSELGIALTSYNLKMDSIESKMPLRY